MGTKFGLFDKVFFLDTARSTVSEAVVEGIRIMATDVVTSEAGEPILKAWAVVYHMKGGYALAETECFSSAEECRKHWQEVLGKEQ